MLRPIKYSVENYLRMKEEEKKIFDVVQSNILNELKEVEFNFSSFEILNIVRYTINNKYVLIAKIDNKDRALWLDENGKFERILDIQ